MWKMLYEMFMLWLIGNELLLIAVFFKGDADEHEAGRPPRGHRVP